MGGGKADLSDEAALLQTSGKSLLAVGGGHSEYKGLEKARHLEPQQRCAE